MHLHYAGNKVGSASDVVTVVVVSLVSVFFVSSVIIFIIGFVCGHYFSQKFKQSPKETPNQPAPLYEDVLPSAVNHQEQAVELKENVAYGPTGK